jgi:two-component system, response regulator PdtaR
MLNKSYVILVVDDIPLIRMGVADLFVRAGFEALEAESADGAIRILEARRDIHLVFTDVGMPGTMDGIKLAHYIRDRWPPVKLIVASGKSVVEESQLPWGVKFFSKPYDEGVIIQTILGILSEANGEELLAPK